MFVASSQTCHQLNPVSEGLAVARYNSTRRHRISKTKTKAVIPLFPADIDRDAFGNYLSGFTDGEGCFSLEEHMAKSTSGRECLYRRATFQVSLRIDDIEILRVIMSFLGCGTVVERPRQIVGDRTARFLVSNKSELHDIIIPQFTQYPLRAKKKRDFEIWRKGVDLMYAVGIRGYQSGTHKKWTTLESDKFNRLLRLLRDQRRVDFMEEQTRARAASHAQGLFEFNKD